MASRTLTLDLKEAARYLHARGQSVHDLDLTRPLGAVAVLLSAAAKECFARSAGPDGTPWKPLRFPRANGGNVPLRDTGLLMASLSARGAQGHVEEVGRASLLFGTNLEYARIHQEGGVIKPKKGKYLAIPLTREARRAVSPRRFPADLFVIKSRKGNLLLAQTAANGRGITPQYLLVTSVTIPARPFLGLTPKLIERINHVIGDYVAKQLT